MKKSKATKRKRGASVRSSDLVRRSERLSHATLLQLIGEIDGVALESDGPHTVVVILEIGGRRIELIRDSGVNISHHITRIGIADVLKGKPK